MSLRKEATGTLSDGVIMVMFLGSETEVISNFKKFQMHAAFDFLYSPCYYYCQ